MSEWTRPAQPVRCIVYLTDQLTVRRERGVLVQGDENANAIVAEVYQKKGVPYDLTGATITLTFVRPDNFAAPPIIAEITGENHNIAIATLTDICYRHSGVYAASLKLHKGDTDRTIVRLIGDIISTENNGTVSDEQIFPTPEELLETLSQVEEARDNANAAADRANAAASNADTKASVANNAAGEANAAANNANAKAAEANTATSKANTAAGNADAKAAAANSAAALATEKAQVAHEAAGRVDVSIEAATKATGAAQESAAAADAATQEAYNQAAAAKSGAQAANEAAQHGEAVAKRLDVVKVAVEVLPSDADAYGAAEQTDSSTLLRVGIPQLPVRNAMLHMDDYARQVLQRTPTNAEIVISWRVDPITTQLYKRIHGY